MTNVWFDDVYKRLPLLKSNICTEVKTHSDGRVFVTLSSNVPAFFVYPEFSGEGRFSDASFTLMPCSPVTVEYIGNATADQLEAGLTVYQLAGTY